MDQLGELPAPRESSEDWTSLKKKNARLQREVRRLRETVSFQLGLHLTTAVRRPWKLLILPISFPMLVIRLGLQRLGRHPVQTSVDRIDVPFESRNHCVVLFPTNGVGFGHFSRMYAVARELRRQDPKLEIIFFTPMPTLHVLYNDEFPTYHLAGRYKHKNMSASEWNGVLEDMLHVIFDLHKPRGFVFDGAFPYRGMLNAIASQPEMRCWWMKRGSLKLKSTTPVDGEGFFNEIIVPAETEHEDSVSRFRQVNPIFSLDVSEAWSREKSKARLSIPLDAITVYVQLGAGRINNIDTDLKLVLDDLLAREGVYVVLGESMLGERLNFSHSRLRLIRDYPNMLYAKGFDAAIQAGGYNSFQEMRIFGIPTLFIPNVNTGMDDQLRRCERAVSEGWGLVEDKPTTKSIERQITRLLNMQKPTPRALMNGAVEAADMILNQLIRHDES